MIQKRKTAIRLLIFLLLVIWSFFAYFFSAFSTPKIKNKVSSKKKLYFKRKIEDKGIIGFIKHKDIWKLSPDNTPQRLTFTPEEERSIQVSPDGKKIFFVREQNGSDGIWAFDVKTGKESLITAGEEIDKIKASYDNKFIAYVEVGGFNLKIISIDGGFIRNITADFSLEDKTENRIDDFNWSYDNERLVFNFRKVDKSRQEINYVYIVNKDGTNRISLPLEGENPVWSPDGRMIALKDRTKENGDFLRLIDLQNNNFVKSVEADSNEKILTFNWSEDSDRVAYVTVRTDNEKMVLNRLNVFDLKTGGKKFSFLPDKEISSFKNNNLFWDNKETIFFNAEGALLSVNIKDGKVKRTAFNIDQFDLKRNFYLFNINSLVFNSNRIVYSIEGNIWAMNYDGTEKTQLIQTPEEEKDPSISSDGKKIVYVKRGPSGDESIWIINSDGSNPYKFFAEKSKRYFFPSWSFNGKKIIFGSSSLEEKFATEIRSLGINKYISPIRVTPFENYYYFSARQSSSGKKIIFSGRGYSEKKSSIWISRSSWDSPGRVKIDNMKSINSASFSPDGNKIVFSGTETANGSFDLWVANLDGSNLHRITDYREMAKIDNWKNGGALSPSWFSDERQIVFYSKTAKYLNISKINPDGSDYRDLSVD
ncbi:MAG: PD40 domain-containing protein [Actinobacteria bacterium]|nr:PD40 domain-containing protein [Actinomycetota bacterium]